jgi:hypothetical protein
MQKRKVGQYNSSLSELASMSDYPLLRDAICDTELSSCQRKLQNDYKIKRSLEDPEELRSLLKIRSIIYRRMADLCAIKGDRIIADYYGLLESAIKSAIAHGEFAEQNGGSRYVVRDPKTGAGKKADKVK